MLATDVNNTQFTGAVDPDSVMIARFYKRAIRNNFESEKQGRPIFEDLLYCEYYPAGNTLLKMDVPAHDIHKQRFSKQWAYYQATQKEDGGVAGTPLSQWAILSPADAENLRGFKFQTIENIAAASDMQLQALGMGIAGLSAYVLRARAQAYLGSAQDHALPEKQAQEMELMKEKMRLQNEQIEKLMALVETKAKPKGKREWTPEQKAEASARMKKAREARGKHGIYTAATD